MQTSVARIWRQLRLSPCSSLPPHLVLTSPPAPLHRFWLLDPTLTSCKRTCVMALLSAETRMDVPLMLVPRTPVHPATTAAVALSSSALAPSSTTVTNLARRESSENRRSKHSWVSYKEVGRQCAALRRVPLCISYLVSLALSILVLPVLQGVVKTLARHSMLTALPGEYSGVVDRAESNR